MNPVVLLFLGTVVLLFAISVIVQLRMAASSRRFLETIGKETQESLRSTREFRERTESRAAENRGRLDASQQTQKRQTELLEAILDELRKPR